MNNRTFDYLQPSFKLREQEFRDTLYSLCILNYYAMDSDYYKVYNITSVENIIFLQVDTLGFFNYESKNYFKSSETALAEYKLLLNKLKEYSFFETHYKCKEKHKEILVFNLPEVIIKGKKINTVENFFNGKYSELWTEEQLEIMFAPIENGEHYEITRNENSKRNRIKSILKKDSNFKQIYIDIIYNKFGTRLTELDIKEDQELDMAAKFEPEKEILGDVNILYQVGLKTIENISNPQTELKSEDFI